MPLVRIDLERTRTTEQIAAIADAIHLAIVETYGIPERDRFQVVSAREPSEIIAQDAGLGFERTSPVMIQIFTQRGRTDVAKQGLYAAIADRLVGVGVEEQDVFIGYVESGPQDWSFGYGRAQYLTGELVVPSA
jgi:hypothetical protein